ncbi:MAG: hypothetical protein NT085_02195 [candidate division SR1 bacterium]|nr:hypothetical protein [candidate division SR1 bacterium]
MGQYKEAIENVINDKYKQDELIDHLLSVIYEGGYSGVIIFGGNYLVGVNTRNESIPCVPEEFLRNGKVIDQESLNTCKKMDNERFDTGFSFFSLKISLELFSKITIEKQLLLSADDKYIENEPSVEYLKKGYDAIPDVYRNELENTLGGENATKEHLSKIVSVLCDRKGNKGKYNDYIMSEKFLLRRFYTKKKRVYGRSYNEYYHSLGTNFTSCSLELFHLLTILKERKSQIFEHGTIKDKICVFLFVPDACVSSAMQSGLAVSKTDEMFEIINITQMTTVENGVIMITKITKDGVVRI